jgi:uncharacterized protein DUF4129
VRSRAVAATLVLVCLHPGAAFADSIDDLSARVDAATEAAREGLAHPSAELMDRVRATVGLPTEVVIAGRPVRVAADPLLDRLGGREAADFEAAIRRLRAIGESIEATAEVVPASEAELRAELREAAGTVGSAEPGLLERARRFVESLLQALVGRGIRALRGGPAWVVLAAVLGLVLLGVWRLRARPVPLAPVRSVRGGPTAIEWRRLADEARRGGDLAGAVVALYRSLVVGLAERGVVEDRPSLTAGEVRAAVVAGAPGLAGTLRDATRRYERIRYGMAPATEDDLVALMAAERGTRAA